MLISKLLAPVTLIAVFAIASAEASKPQDDVSTNEMSAETDAAPNPARVETGVTVLTNVDRPGPRFENVAMNATPENRWLHDMLSKPVPPLDFPGETPLSEILEMVATYYSTTFGAGAGPDGGDFRMTICPDTPELELEGISSLEDVTVSDVQVEGVKLRNALKLIFDRTTEPELTYVIQNQVLMVTSRAKAESDSNLYTRVYNVGQLAELKFRATQNSRPRLPRILDDAPPRGGVWHLSVPPQSSPGKKATPAKVDHGIPIPTSDLESLIMEMATQPAKWVAADGEGGAIRLVGHVLFVRQTPAVHEQIVDLLNRLDRDSAYDTRIYRVGALADLQFPAHELPGVRNASGNPIPLAVMKSNLESLIMQMTGRDWQEINGEGGAIRRVGRSLVIRQTAAVHRQIIDLLDLLSRMSAADQRGS